MYIVTPVSGHAAIAAASRASDPRQAMQRIADEALSLVPQAVGASIVCEGNGHLITVAGSGICRDHVGSVARVQDTLAGPALAEGVGYIVADVDADPRVAAAVRADPRIRTTLAVPLHADGRVVAMLVMVGAQPGAFGPRLKARVERVAAFVGSAIGSVIDTARLVGLILDEAASPDEDSELVTAFVSNVMAPGSVQAAGSREAIARVLAERAIQPVVQPIVDLHSGTTVGVEALARFDSEPRRGPDAWFAAAHAVGLGLELEELAASRALDLLPGIPDAVSLTVNGSYEMLVSGRMLALLRSRGVADRILVELTEHGEFASYARAREAIAELRSAGARVAIDDVGAGFASFRHVLELQPDTIKLDRFFTERIEADRARRAMAEGVVHFARQTGVSLVAEGIETEDELDAVLELGVGFGQGYLLARPAPVAGTSFAPVAALARALAT